MIIDNTSPEEKRKNLRMALSSGTLQQFPGAYNPLVAMLIEKLGFHGVYVSGAVMANSMGLPDIGLTTQSEVVEVSSRIGRVVSLPTILDIDTGFGETMNVVRTITELEFAGLSGFHMEDQVNPKRCGHLDNKQVVTRDEMVQKIRSAVDARRDPNFLIIARTDSRAVEGLEAAIERSKAYEAAGADMIFPEALKDESEFEAFRKAVNVPLMANMTEFGKSKLLGKDQLVDLGYNLVIYPVTTQRLALKAVERGLTAILENGSQHDILDDMQTRSELYELLRYEDYNTFDQSLYNFKLNKDQ